MSPLSPCWGRGGRVTLLGTGAVTLVETGDALVGTWCCVTPLGTCRPPTPPRHPAGDIGVVTPPAVRCWWGCVTLWGGQGTPWWGCDKVVGTGGCHSPGDRGVSPLGGGTAGRDSPRHPNGDTRWAQGSALRMRTTCPANRTRAHPQAARTAHCACALHRIGPGAHAHAQPRGAARMRVRSPRPSRRCAHAHSPPAPTGRTHARCRCPLRDNACAVRPRRPRP